MELEQTKWPVTLPGAGTGEKFKTDGET